MRKLIIIRGPLGVGKSTVSKLLAREINADYISIDDVLDAHGLATDDGIPVENFIKANTILLHQLTLDRDTVVDGNFYYEQAIDDLVQRCDRETHVFTLTADVETCIERDAARKIPHGEAAARYVYMITSQVSAGEIIDVSQLTSAETAEIIRTALV